MESAQRNPAPKTSGSKSAPKSDVITSASKSDVLQATNSSSSMFTTWIPYKKLSEEGDNGEAICNDSKCPKHNLGDMGSSNSDAKETGKSSKLHYQRHHDGSTSTQTLRTTITAPVSPKQPGEGLTAMHNHITTSITHNNNNFLEPSLSPSFQMGNSSPKIYDEMRREHCAKENAMLQIITAKQNEDIEALKEQLHDLQNQLEEEKRTRRVAIHALKQVKALSDENKKKVETLSNANKILKQKLQTAEMKATKVKHQLSLHTLTANKMKSKMGEARAAQKELEERHEYDERLCTTLSKRLRESRIKIKQLKKVFGVDLDENEVSASDFTLNTLDTSMLESEALGADCSEACEDASLAEEKNN